MSLRINRDVLNSFQADWPGRQERINAVRNLPLHSQGFDLWPDGR
jgi:uncharacterized protein (DUF4415 family)